MAPRPLRQESKRARTEKPEALLSKALLQTGAQVGSLCPALSAALNHRALTVAEQAKVPVTKNQLERLCMHCACSLSSATAASVTIQEMSDRQRQRAQRRLHKKNPRVPTWQPSCVVLVSCKLCTGVSSRFVASKEDAEKICQGYLSEGVNIIVRRPLYIPEAIPTPLQTPEHNKPSADPTFKPVQTTIPPELQLAPDLTSRSSLGSARAQVMPVPCPVQTWLEPDEPPASLSEEHGIIPEPQSHVQQVISTETCVKDTSAREVDLKQIEEGTSVLSSGQTSGLALDDPMVESLSDDAGDCAHNSKADSYVHTYLEDHSAVAAVVTPSDSSDAESLEEEVRQEATASLEVESFTKRQEKRKDGKKDGMDRMGTGGGVLAPKRSANQGISSSLLQSGKKVGSGHSSRAVGHTKLVKKATEKRHVSGDLAAETVKQAQPAKGRKMTSSTDTARGSYLHLSTTERVPSKHGGSTDIGVPKKARHRIASDVGAGISLKSSKTGGTARSCDAALKNRVVTGASSLKLASVKPAERKGVVQSVSGSDKAAVRVKKRERGHS